MTASHTVFRGHTWHVTSFDALAHWRNGPDQDHRNAFAAFLRSAKAVADGATFGTKSLGVSAAHLRDILALARAEAHMAQDADACRLFFERHFTPVRCDSPQPHQGLLTGYYEPHICGARHQMPDFPVPLLRRPDDLVEIAKDYVGDTLPSHWPKELRFGRRTENGLVPYYDRAAIEGDWNRGTQGSKGALDHRGLELVWLPNRIEAFFIHIQGSASIALADGRVMRVSYDGKSGQAYTAIGAVLKRLGALPRPEDHGQITMASIRAWLTKHPDQQRKIMQMNKSYIFFKEDTDLDPELGPKGAADVQLTPGSSLAVDRTLHTFHTPIFVERASGKDARLMIAQDTGSAILGVERGDYFAGSGTKAGALAGAMQDPCSFVILVPKGQIETQAASIGGGI